MPSSETINIDLKNIIQYGYKQEGKCSVSKVLRLKLELLRDRNMSLEQLKHCLLETVEDFCVVFIKGGDVLKEKLVSLIINANSKEILLDRFYAEYLYFLDKNDDSGIKDEELVSQVVVYLKTCSVNELRMVTAESLADKFNVTREHLSRLFKQRHSCSLSKRILKARLDRVFYLLQQESCNNSIKSIAMSVGITNYARFKKQFSDRFSYPPSVMKKINKNIL